MARKLMIYASFERAFLDVYGVPKTGVIGEHKMWYRGPAGAIDCKHPGMPDRGLS